jgi:hypothetical protein
LLSSLIEPLILKKKFVVFEIILGLFAIAGILIIYNTHLQFSIGIFLKIFSHNFFLLLLPSLPWWRGAGVSFSDLTRLP